VAAGEVDAVAGVAARGTVEGDAVAEDKGDAVAARGAVEGGAVAAGEGNIGAAGEVPQGI